MVLALAFGICQVSLQMEISRMPSVCTFHLLNLVVPHHRTYARLRTPLCTPVAVACPHGIQVWCIRGLLLNASPCMHQCLGSCAQWQIARVQVFCSAVLFCATNAVPCHKTVLHVQQAHCQATSAEAGSRTM